jgi:hypothetical protein
LRYTNCQYKTRPRRYLRLSIPICAAVRKSMDGKPADSFGDFMLSTVFSCKGANQWITMHNAVTSFLFKCAKQARLGETWRRSSAHHATGLETCASRPPRTAGRLRRARSC